MEESLLLSLIKLPTLSCAHTSQSINFFVKLLSKQEPLNGRKNLGETTKYLYFSKFFDSKNSQFFQINVKLTQVLQYIVY
jgi:hypothetical protein